MEYLKVNGTEYPAHFCGKQIDRDWDGRASKTVTLAMPYAQAVQLFVDGLRWVIVRREAGADDAAQEQVGAIEKLRRSARWDTLPEKLRQTAALRLEYPELSLVQLAEKCDPPVTKSCMNHRMRKLMEEAKEL